MASQTPGTRARAMGMSTHRCRETSGRAQVAATATTIARLPTITERRAVRGSLIQWSEKMKSEAERRYAVSMT